MNLLVDTHIAIWATLERQYLSAKAKDVLLDPGSCIFVSTVSIWEIAIKRSFLTQGAARSDLPPLGAREAIEVFTASGFGLLDVTPRHASTVEDLPNHHGDPFDRLLIAQALAEPMRFMTADKRLGEYSELVMVV